MSPVLPFAAQAPTETDDLPPEPIETDDLPPEPAEAPPDRSAPSTVIEAEVVPATDPQARAEAEARQLRLVVTPMMVRAEHYVCASPEDYANAAALLEELAKMEQVIDEKLGPIIDDAFKTHRGLTALRAEMKDPITARQRAIKQRAAQWRDEEDRKARQEAERLAAEQRRLEQAQAAETAAKLETAGDTQSADLVRQQAANAPAPAVHVPSAVPKVDGMVGRYEYGFEIVDCNAIPDEYWLVDDKSLLAVVRRQKESCAIPGIRVTKTPTTTFRKGVR